MISLIINADDLGRSPERDRGILEAFQYGIVTSASLLANGASFVTAVSLVKKAGLPFFRVHVAGDFYSPAYVRKWMLIQTRPPFRFS